MSTWVSHLIIADRALEAVPGLDRRGFCVGNIAPDCNVENADWTAFTPSRERTHWMSVENDKSTADCEGFYRAYIESRADAISSAEEYAFLLGYWAHLITDVEFQRTLRDDKARVDAAWARVLAHPALAEQAKGLEKSWASVKRLIPKEDRMKDIYAIEAEYLAAHPDSGYLTELLPLQSFPDYIDYLPKGAIVRKIGVVGYLPTAEESAYPFIALSREEYAAFLDRAEALVTAALRRAVRFPEPPASQGQNKT